MKLGVFFVLIFSVVHANAGCLDGLPTSSSVSSKIRGFYINRNFTDESQLHSVILDKATCTATTSGDVTLVSTTRNYYYLNFRSSDKTLYSTLLSAQAKDIVVEFRIGPPIDGSSSNSIAYVITPAGARSQ